jgi:two-component system OmpR family sensor kinase
MDVETVDLLETVDRSARRAKALDDGQRVEVHPSERPLMVRADARRIEQVLDNLLVNALQHTPEAGAITIGATATDGEARVRVHNTGSYISPEERESIFQRFYRGSNDGKGAGLGLAIASEIARAHGGEIMVDSSPGDGTAFTLVLPLSSSGQRVNAGAAA